MADAEIADSRHMAAALQLAKRGLFSCDPNPRVGALIVQGDTVVGSGWHERAGGPHAEAAALAAAGPAARGATCYVTLEPCAHHGRTPPCTDALIAAGVTRVVAGALDPNPAVNGGGFARLRAAGIEVKFGVMEAQAKALNPGFHRRMAGGRPWVRIKSAMSLDGRTALANGASQWITGPAARNDVQRLRARSSAVVTGVGTVLADDPQLTVRGAALETSVRQPIRVVLDSQLRTPAHARLFETTSPVYIFTSVHGARSPARRALEAAGARVETLPTTPQERLDLTAALDRLAEIGCNEILVEAGATLSGAWLEAEAADELWIYVAPTLLGPGAQGLYNTASIDQMAARRRLQIDEVRKIGADWRIRARPCAADDGN